MSYARLGQDHSEVYVYMNVDGHLDCCFCALSSRTFQADSTVGMIEHLHRHQNAGHHVPDYIFDDLWADHAENFPKG